MAVTLVLSSSLLLATVTMATDSGIRTTVNIDVPDDTPRETKIICNQHVEEKRVILNCSGIDLSVHVEAFENLDQSVHVLDISYTGLTKLSPFTADNTFKNLLVLNASHNLIEHIDENMFDRFSNLEKLDLSFNSIEELPKAIFVPMSDLRFLDLSNNRIISLPNALPMTEWFDVSSNQLQSIPEKYSSVLYPQTVFLLGNNPFICTCDLLWLKDLLSTREYLLKFLTNLDPKKFTPVCSSPDHLTGKSWDTLEDNEFKCTGLDGNRFESANEKSSYKLWKEVKVTVSEIGSNWVIFKWDGYSDERGGEVIEIQYHRFGQNTEKKLVILPISASKYRLKNLETNAPYVVCFTIMFGTDSYSLGCEEILTAKSEDITSFSNIYNILKGLVIDYSSHLVILLILSITTLYILQRQEPNKEEKQYF